jgi:hypothetical protein
MGRDTMSAAFAVGFGFATGAIAGAVFAGICLAIAWLLVEVAANCISWLRSR